MRNVVMTMAALLALVGSAWARQNAKEKRGDSSTPEASDTCELRAYLLNKERETINIVGVTALLVVDGKDGADVLIPLQLVTTKTGEKNAVHSARAPRVLEGTAYSVSLITVKSDGSRRSEGSDADRRTAQGVPQEPSRKPPASSDEADKAPFILEGPYFKADLTREQIGAFSCKASVRITIHGAIHTAKGFSCALAKEERITAARCPRVAACCQEVERHVKAGEMNKAADAVDHLSASLSEPCGEACCNQIRHGCASCCNDLRAAISSGKREQALEALETLKAQCCPGASPKSELKPDGGGK